MANYLIAQGRIVPPLFSQRSSGIVVDDCPYCHRQHRHSLASDEYPGAVIQRQADCFRGEYRIRFDELEAK